MKFRVASRHLVVLEHERHAASSVALQVLLRVFACPSTTFLTYWRLSLRLGPELRGLSGGGQANGDAMEWRRASGVVQASLRLEFPDLPNRMPARERERALADERILLEVLTDHGDLVAHPLAGWPERPAHPTPRAVTRRRR